MERGQFEVKLDPALMTGKKLWQVLFIPDWEIQWYLMSEDPDTRNVDEFISLQADQAVEKFPEIEELLAQKPDRKVIFQKGKTSGRWIDFV